MKRFIYVNATKNGYWMGESPGEIMANCINEYGWKKKHSIDSNTTRYGLWRMEGRKSEWSDDSIQPKSEKIRLNFAIVSLQRVKISAESRIQRQRGRRRGVGYKWTCIGGRDYWECVRDSSLRKGWFGAIRTSRLKPFFSEFGKHMSLATSRGHFWEFEMTRNSNLVFPFYLDFRNIAI